MNDNIFFKNLRKVKLPVDEFYEKAFNHNLKNRNLKSRNFCDFTAGLLSFRKMLNHLNGQLNYNLDLYAEEINYHGDKKKIYYAIDKSGLIHGYILGPTNLYTDSLSDEDENLYFGKGKVYKHALVKNWKNKNCILDFETFKKTYLPLGLTPMDKKWDGAYRYFILYREI